MSNRESSNLCASCDRCRARKTRCDGQRPCNSCKQKYMKKHKLTNVDGIDEALFECFYSPAKRRGPVPGHKSKENGDGAGSSKRKKSSKRPQLQKQSSKMGTLSLNIAEDGSVTSTHTTGGGMSLSGMSLSNMSLPGVSVKMGSSQQLNPMGSAASVTSNYAPGNNGSFPLLPPLDPNAAALQQHVLSTLGTIGINMFGPTSAVSDNNGNKGGGGGGGGMVGSGGVAASSSSTNLSGGQSSSSGGQQQDTMANAQNAAQQQLAYIQQLQLQQQMQAQKQRRLTNAAALDDIKAAALGSSPPGQKNGIVNGSNNAVKYGSNNSVSSKKSLNGKSRVGRSKSKTQLPSSSSVPVQQQLSRNGVGNKNNNHETSDTGPVLGCDNPDVRRYAPLIHPNNSHGMHLRACYTLSFGGLFGLPPIPTNEEYCARFDKSLEPHQLPKFDVAALQAARFAELAMGALVDSNCNIQTSMGSAGRSLLLALANASVLCLADCVEEQVHPSLMFDMARTYFFHAILRAQFDDMGRYFRYRRVCLRHLSQLDGVPGVETLMAAISFQDSLAYMIYNASEADLPNIDGSIPRVSAPYDVDGSRTTDAEKKYGISTLPSRVAASPVNQMWIQGTPPILINEAAPPKSRVLDALACTIRTSLDEAKSRQIKEQPQSSRGKIISRKRKFLSDADAEDKSVTEWAVNHHPDDLSCSSLLPEASNLLKKDEEESTPALPSIFGGHRLLVSALDVILNLDGEAEDFQMQKIFNILEGMIERPILLSQGGPTYHIFNNCAIFLAHIINKFHAGGLNDVFATAQFEVALNFYNGSRIVLEKHRSKLPHRLRCHEIPRPHLNASSGELVIDMSNTSLCNSRNCQACIAVGISPKEAAKRVSTNNDSNNWQKSDSEKEFDCNDHALLSILRRIISQEEMM